MIQHSNMPNKTKHSPIWLDIQIKNYSNNSVTLTQLERKKIFSSNNLKSQIILIIQLLFGARKSECLLEIPIRHVIWVLFSISVCPRYFVSWYISLAQIGTPLESLVCCPLSVCSSLILFFCKPPSPLLLKKTKKNKNKKRWKGKCFEKLRRCVVSDFMSRVARSLAVVVVRGRKFSFEIPFLQKMKL